MFLMQIFLTGSTTRIIVNNKRIFGLHCPLQSSVFDKKTFIIKAMRINKCESTLKRTCLIGPNCRSRFHCRFCLAFVFVVFTSSSFWIYDMKLFQNLMLSINETNTLSHNAIRYLCYRDVVFRVDQENKAAISPHCWTWECVSFIMRL